MPSASPPAGPKDKAHKLIRVGKCAGVLEAGSKYKTVGDKR
jgi:hypothetical protein